MTAKRVGCENILFLDNDVMPEKDILVQLLSYNVPMITPMVIDGNSGVMLGGPIRDKNTGVYQQKWSSMSFLLMKVCLLDLPGVDFKETDTEGRFYHRFAVWGHTVHIDTSQVLHTLTPPTRPDSMLYEEREQLNRDNYSHIFEKRIPMDAIAQEMLDEKNETGNDRQMKVIKM